MTEYIVVPKSEYNLKKWEIFLSVDDLDRLLKYRDVFVKFLDKTLFSYQIELCKWTYRGKEEELYRSITTIAEIKESLLWLEKTFKDYLDKTRKE